MCGCPVVACHVGGVDSMVRHDVDGFLVPANDPYMGAYRIYQLFKDNGLNVSMGAEGKNVAVSRHNRQSIVDGLLDIYNDILTTERT